MQDRAIGDPTKLMTTMLAASGAEIDVALGRHLTSMDFSQHAINVSWMNAATGDEEALRILVGEMFRDTHIIPIIHKTTMQRLMHRARESGRDLQNVAVMETEIRQEIQQREWICEHCKKIVSWNYRWKVLRDKSCSLRTFAAQFLQDPQGE